MMKSKRMMKEKMMGRMIELELEIYLTSEVLAVLRDIS